MVFTRLQSTFTALQPVNSLTGLSCTIRQLADHRYCLRGFAMQITLNDAQMASPSRIYGGPYFKEQSYQSFAAHSPSTPSSLSRHSCLPVIYTDRLHWHIVKHPTYIALFLWRNKCKAKLLIHIQYIIIIPYLSRFPINHVNNRYT